MTGRYGLKGAGALPVLKKLQGFHFPASFYKDGLASIRRKSYGRTLVRPLCLGCELWEKVR